MASLRIFLCHSSKDKTAVRDLYHWLRNEGFDPWFDEESLLPGQKWEPEISKAVRSSDIVIVCLSSNAVNQAGYIHKEIKNALDIADQQPEDSIFLIPLKLEDCDVPNRLSHLQWVNLFETKGYDRLRRALQARAKVLGLAVSKDKRPMAKSSSKIEVRKSSNVQDSISERSLSKDSHSPPEFQEVWKIQTSHKPEHLFAGPNYLCLVTKEAIHFLSSTDGQPLLPPLTTIENLSLVDYPITGGVFTRSGNLLLTVLPPDVSGKASLWSVKLISQNEKSLKGIFCQCLYEAPGAQLSAPVIDNEVIYLIQRGPELVMLDLKEDLGCHTLPLPKLDNIHRDCVSFTFAANYLCLALCDGTILALDPHTGQTLTTLRERDGYVLSTLATDDLHIFFGTSVGRKSVTPSHIHAINAASGQRLWDFEIPPDPSGFHRSIDGQPLVINDTLYVTGRNHYLHALDMSTDQELLRYEMPGGIDLGPVWTGEAVIVADRQGNVQALRVDRPVFTITCHYDLNMPPVLNEWNPLIFMLDNTSNDIVRNIVLRLAGDFQGKTKHDTQRLYTIPPNTFKRCAIELKPTAAGATVHLDVMIDYQRNNLTYSQKLALSVPVRRSNLARAIIRETGTSPDGRWRYNYTALRALLIAALTNIELSQICFLHFHSIYNSWPAGMDKHEKINELIEYIDQHQQVEQLLMVIEQGHPVRYEQYIQEIKHEIGYTE